MREPIEPKSLSQKELGAIRVQKLLRAGQAVPGDLLYDLEIEEIPMLAEGIFPKVGVVGLFGSSDTGKSAFLRQFAISISNGLQTFLGAKLNPKHGKVLYVTTEDDHYATCSLIRRQSNHNRDALKNIKFLFDSGELADFLEYELSESPVDCVIVDAYSDVLKGDMNQANVVRNFLNNFSELAVAHECLFIFLHHSGKGKQNLPPSKDNVLGSQGFEAKMRILIEFRADPVEPDLRHICIVKGNYVKAKDKTSSYVIQLNKDLIFKNTGKRTPFHELVVSDSKGLSNDTKVVNRIRELRNDGLSLRKTSDALAKEGIHLSKSQLGVIVNEKIEPPGSASEDVDEPFLEDYFEAAAKRCSSYFGKYLSI